MRSKYRVFIRRNNQKWHDAEEKSRCADVVGERYGKLSICGDKVSQRWRDGPGGNWKFPVTYAYLIYGWVSCGYICVIRAKDVQYKNKIYMYYLLLVGVATHSTHRTTSAFSEYVKRFLRFFYVDHLTTIKALVSPKRLNPHVLIPERYSTIVNA